MTRIRQMMSAVLAHLGAVLGVLGACAIGAALLSDALRGQTLSIGWTELFFLVGGLLALVSSVPHVRRASRSLYTRSLAESEAARQTLTTHPLRYVLYSVWFALLVSLVEVALRTYEGALGWRVMPRDYLWKIPVGYLALIGVVGAIGFAATSMRPGLPRLRVLMFCYLTIGLTAVLLILAPGGVDIATPFVAAGLSVHLSRIAERHAYALHAISRKSIVPVAVACSLLVAVGTLWPVWQERRAIARLPEAARSSPNVLLIVLDTVRARGMGLYGYERPTTPRLDRFASGGLVFDRAISTSPWTLPSHGSMFTGRYPHSLSAGWTTPIDGAHATLAETLSARGYLTAGFVGNFIYGGAEYGLGRGFAHYEDHVASLSTALATTSIGMEVMERVRDIDNFASISRPEHKTAAVINSEFLGWLASREGDRPYFAFLNYFDTHSPYPPPPIQKTRFSSGAPHRNSWSRPLNRWSAEDIRGFNNAYDDALSYLDDQVGQLLETLSERGELDNTLVIVTADHGEQFGEHGLLDHAASLYLPLVHVPLIMRYPARIPAGRVGHAVSLRDIPSTILDAIGQGQTAIPGRSLIDWSTGLAAAPGSVMLSEVERTTAAYPASFPARRGRMKSIVFDDMHFIKNYGSGREELYRLTDDFDEQHDLAPGNPELVGRFRARLDVVLTSPAN